MDHSPRVFKIILTILSSEHIRFPSRLSDDMWDALELEIDYFGLTELRKKLRRPLRFVIDGTYFTTNPEVLTRPGWRLLRKVDGVLEYNDTFIPGVYGDIVYYRTSDTF